MSKHKKIALKFFIFFAVVLGIYFFHRAGFSHRVISWMEGLGSAKPAVFLVAVVIGTIFCVPSMLLTFAGGFLFSFWTAAILSTLGSGAGSLSAFLIGRYLIRSWVETQAHRIREFERISSMVRTKGWKIVLLARLSPIFPFLIGNYAFGTTRMRARHYFLASMAGTIPSVLVYTYSGHLAGSLSGMPDFRTRTPLEWGLLGLGFAATVGVSLYLRHLARAQLRD